MDAASSLTRETTHELRNQIDVTRRALTQKIDHLGGEMRHVVDELSHTVSDTIGAARRAVSPADWVRSRPLLTCVGALCVGVLVARRMRVGAPRIETGSPPRVGGSVVKMVAPVLAGLAQAAGRQAVTHFLGGAEAAPRPVQESPKPPAEG